MQISKLNMLFMLILVVIILLFLQQCNVNKSLKQKAQQREVEMNRIAQNYAADTASIKELRLKNGKLQAEKIGYELTVDELIKDKKDLIGDLEFKKNKPPQTVIKLVTEIKDSITEIPIYIKTDSLKNSLATFSDSAKYDSTNFRYLSGSLPYKIKYFSKTDSVELNNDSLDFYAKLSTGGVDFELNQGISLIAALVQDEKTKKVTIKVETKYPGLKFTDIQGANIMQTTPKKVLRSFRKEYGVGLTVGYGFGVNPNTGTAFMGPLVGVGIHYSPKWAQWGN